MSWTESKIETKTMIDYDNPMYPKIYEALKTQKARATDYDRPWRSWMYLHHIDQDYPELMALNKHQLLKTLHHPLLRCKNCGCDYSDIFSTDHARPVLTCSKKCENSLATKRMSGTGNTVHRQTPSTKKRSKARASKTMKAKIASGAFTPCVTNSWAKSRCYVGGHPFRSSWEALFWITNQKTLFEKIRVPYTYDGESHSYIIDFVDEETKTLYEVKPSSKISDPKVVAKEQSAKIWATNNGYTFRFVSDDYYKSNIQKIETVFYSLSQGLDYNTCRLMRQAIKIFKGQSWHELNQSKK